LGVAHFSGAYYEPSNLQRLVRGVVAGSLLLAAVYGFLPLEYRTSRMLLLLGSVWAFIAMLLTRTVWHLLRHRDLRFGESRQKNFAIVAGEEEKDRVLGLVNQIRIRHNFIGWVSPNEEAQRKDFLSTVQQLDEVVRIYKIDELFFCSKDLSAQQIMSWMTTLGPDISYRIVPEESLSIIGSHSKNSAGELYTIDIQFRIAQFMNRRNKRLLDVLSALLFLVLSPVLIFVVRKKGGFLSNLFKVLFGSCSWVGYVPNNSLTSGNLPNIRNGVLSPASEWSDATQQGKAGISPQTAQRLNFIYARDYTIDRDIDIILKGIRDLGQ
ncbi:MAG: glycosyl transferase family 2, partial [Bacteroidota bacterium]